MTIDRESEAMFLAALTLRRELIAEGWNDKLLARAVRRGQLARPRRGAYVDASVWRDADARSRHLLTARAVLAQADTRLLLSHDTGLLLHGAPTWGLDLSTVHVTRPDARAGRREAGVAQHRGKVLAGDESSRHGLPVSSATRLALETTTLHDVETSLVHVNHLLHEGLTTVAELRDRYAAGMARWPSTLTTDLVLRLCDPRCENVAESRTLFLCWDQHLPKPILQYPVYDEWGRVVAVLDFAWPEYKAWAEFDGRIKYTTLLRPGETAADVVLREKRREELVVRLTDMRCRRLIWDDLAHPRRTGDMLRRLLFGGGPTDLTA